MLDHFAEWAWIVEDHCRPMSERVWAAAKGVGTAAFLVFGGEVAGKVVSKVVGRLVGVLGEGAADAGAAALEKVAGDAGDEMLKRMAGGPESASRLARLAQESLANPLEEIHGISVTAGELPYAGPFKELPRSVVEQVFRVHDTPLPTDILHRTVELPQPVTKEVAELWNQLWGFKR